MLYLFPTAAVTNYLSHLKQYIFSFSRTSRGQKSESRHEDKGVSRAAPSVEAPGEESLSLLSMAPRGCLLSAAHGLPVCRAMCTTFWVPRFLFCSCSSCVPFLSASVTAFRPQGMAQDNLPIPGLSTESDPWSYTAVSAGLGLGPRISIRGATVQFTHRWWAEEREKKRQWKEL